MTVLLVFAIIALFIFFPEVGCLAVVLGLLIFSAAGLGIIP